MELILLIIYSTIVWFIFFKKKWLPWNITSQVIVVTIPVIMLAMIILFMNIVAPSSSDVRAMNYVIPISPRVTGRGHRSADRAEPADQEGRCALQDRPGAVRGGGESRRGHAARTGGSAQKRRGQKSRARPADRPGEKARRAIHRARLDRAREGGPTSSRRKAISEILKANSSPPTPRNRRPRRRSPRPKPTSRVRNTTSTAPRISRRPTAAWRISRCVPACAPRSLPPGR